MRDGWKKVLTLKDRISLGHAQAGVCQVLIN